jgi:hypothetical protein
MSEVEMNEYGAEDAQRDFERGWTETTTRPDGPERPEKIAMPHVAKPSISVSATPAEHDAQRAQDAAIVRRHGLTSREEYERRHAELQGEEEAALEAGYALDGMEAVVVDEDGKRRKCSLAELAEKLWNALFA